MLTATDVPIYLAIRKSEDRSHLEDTLVLDGFDVSTFPTARELWERFQTKPARFVITERRFGTEFTGLDLARQIRQRCLLPYVYIVMLSTMNRLKDIQEGLAGGIDDYLVKPHNPFQLRTRVLVGLRWLAYIDSMNVGAADKTRKSARG
ncbi:MAG: response regulator [Verrucomicrobia bacterium]|nr:response regulator [Verrucomicrobiota bacterium]